MTAPIAFLIQFLSNPELTRWPARALVVEIPITLANKALTILRPILPNPEIFRKLPHLRRLCSRQQLPEPLLRSIPDHSAAQSPDNNGRSIFLLIPPPLPSPEDVIQTTLMPHVGDADGNDNSRLFPRLYETLIPLYPPTTAEQARSWSQQYWPCSFNPASQTLQNGPPLQLLRTTRAELDSARLEEYLGLAHQAARECSDAGFGRNIGAVVVDPRMSKVIAVAGDARWWSPASPHPGNATDGFQGHADGRPEHHALMRAIAMVAETEIRRQDDDDTSSRARGTNGRQAEPADLGGTTLTTIEFASLHHARSAKEDVHASAGALSENRTDAYLCTGLDVYLTHEPCVCCSMAMIHSRFRACVFERRMAGTGGLCAEKDNGGLGYGLFWRPELNWRVMTFEYTPSCQAVEQLSKAAELFHA